MGEGGPVKTYTSPKGRLIAELPSGLLRRKPRSYAEWKALRSWGKLPAWEPEPAGYLLRTSRELAGLTQGELAGRLGVSQQSVAQAERWGSNPTVGFMRAWAAASGKVLLLSLRGPRDAGRGRRTGGRERALGSG
jgi:DNA-binding XRE family transcriptional regulator